MVERQTSHLVIPAVEFGAPENRAIDHLVAVCGGTVELWVVGLTSEFVKQLDEQWKRRGVMVSLVPDPAEPMQMRVRFEPFRAVP